MGHPHSGVDGGDPQGDHNQDGRITEAEVGGQRQVRRRAEGLSCVHQASTCPQSRTVSEAEGWTPMGGSGERG